MKKRMFRVFATLALVTAVITSCTFSSTSLADTHWRDLFLSSGPGYHFVTETTGVQEACIPTFGPDGPLCIEGFGFTYTYNAATKTGVIELDPGVTTPGGLSVMNFSISGNELTLSGDEVEVYRYESNP